MVGTERWDVAEQTYWAQVEGYGIDALRLAALVYNEVALTEQQMDRS